MPSLLRLDSSADTRSSTSRALTGLFTETWRELSPEHEIVERDLHRTPPPHLPDAALHYAPRLRVDGERPDPAAEERQNALLAELSAADVVVIGAPMYNWSVPSTLKAWLDHVHVLGTTVPFDTKDQPLAGKPVVVVSSRGAAYAGTPDAGKDHTVPPIVQILGDSMGMDVTVVTADLTLAARVPAMAPLADTARQNLEAARTQVRDLATELGG
ncbi:NAD(P)H-dependent oxidoreductase [Amycolatopsis acidiphila]|uniref:FMN dependent NADH:quinone oxidoreductase n=1 Tax=Amycolatopsis acidiphila TaxID=715473 RepID=A0A558AA42_9PSEU|nr:NAD(P)H-dependent oxidoreductase [Amycolatopsis acidiphila]TVT21131.1 FMN-dependent NADH-azoreductase [Amycolatopsis acidiphila]UIJ57218.1 NAD(P)H-dependent oxidoreductase [Amycolatopsis acidiphila]GHG52611.1 FMN-dependent NADH-azoreductase [Amycolatopsis acidiphila]